jgi:hypothetical protein
MSIFKVQKIQFKTEVFKKYFLSRGRHVVAVAKVIFWSAFIFNQSDF